MLCTCSLSERSTNNIYNHYLIHVHFEAGKLWMKVLLTISGVTLLGVSIGRVALLEIITMISQLGSPTTFVEFQIMMTLTRTNLN